MAVDAKTSSTKPPTRPGIGKDPEPASKAGIERRHEPRYSCNDAVQIRFLSDVLPIPATVMKVSRSGLCVEIDRAVPEGAQVEILLPRKLALSGKVRYCRCVAARYQLGIMLPEESGASSKSQKHVSADQVTDFLHGHGLTHPHVLQIREHLARCSQCLMHVIDAYCEKRPRAKS